jgi:2-methylfumaryl-CoA isomerase
VPITGGEHPTGDKPAAILSGLRVLEISAFVAAPLGGTTLATLGADVVRVDPPGGGIDAGRWPLHGDASLYWAGLNQGKRSVNIDTRTERGQGLVAELAGSAGILLTNLPVRGWSAYERLARLRPDLIMAVITGNPDGSAAVDYTVNAAVGFPWVTGPESWEGPVNHVLPAWDALTGYLVAAALLAAELHRVRTGEGQLVRISLADVALSIAGQLGFIAEAQLNEEPRGRYGNDLFGTFATSFVSGDGRHLMVAALTARQWTQLVAATGIGPAVRALEEERSVDFGDEGERFRARREIAALVQAWVGARPFPEVALELDRFEVLWGPYRTFKEMVRDDPRCSPSNPMFAEVDQPGIGSFLRPGSPISFSAFSRQPPRPSPLMGEHTAEVLRSWLNLQQRELDELAAAGVIAGGSLSSGQRLG